MLVEANIHHQDHIREHQAATGRWIAEMAENAGRKATVRQNHKGMEVATRTPQLVEEEIQQTQTDIFINDVVALCGRPLTIGETELLPFDLSKPANMCVAIALHLKDPKDDYPSKDRYINQVKQILNDCGKEEELRPKSRKNESYMGYLQLVMRMGKAIHNINWENYLE